MSFIFLHRKYYKFKNGKIILFTVSTILGEENQNFDDLYRSFYERDVEILLNIYFYENKELSVIFKKNYVKHFIYDEDFLDSDYTEKILDFWNDKNIRINEVDKTICFFIPDLYKYFLVNFETQKVNRIKFQNMNCKINYFYDKKSKFYFMIKIIDSKFQLICIYDFNKPLKNIYLPYYFSQIFPTKKGYLLGVVQNTLTVYSFYHHLGRYAPSQTIHTTLCLLKYSI